LEALIDKGLEGVVHLTNSGEATWYDLARCAVETAGIDAEVTPVETAAWPTKARRPVYTVLASEVLVGAGIEPLPPWEDGVREHLARRGIL
jgi:dTDP-4-dehydrorhamnose reductase